MYKEEDKEKDLGRIEADDFVPGTFTSTASKKKSSASIIVDLKKDQIQVPMFELKDSDDSLINVKVRFICYRKVNNYTIYFIS